MTIEQQVVQKLRQLPPEKQKEVMDFVDFLKEKSGGPRTPLNTAGLNGTSGIRASNSTVIENIANNNGGLGLSVSGMYGGNTLVGNGIAPLSSVPGGVSQNNNDRNGTTC